MRVFVPSNVAPVYNTFRGVCVPDGSAGVTQEEGTMGPFFHFLFVLVPHLSSCGACLSFYREKGSAIPFPRRPYVSRQKQQREIPDTARGEGSIWIRVTPKRF
ncbi:unnamed protein product, partial [Ectocarpus sp. 8 AP-2014]